MKFLCNDHFTVNVIGVEKNVTGKVDRSDAIEAESKQATGSSVWKAILNYFK